jgi:hypothetical protein
MLEVMYPCLTKKNFLRVTLLADISGKLFVVDSFDQNRKSEKGEKLDFWISSSCGELCGRTTLERSRLFSPKWTKIGGQFLKQWS